jgi:hypothetical protein
MARKRDAPEMLRAPAVTRRSPYIVCYVRLPDGLARTQAKADFTVEIQVTARGAWCKQ